LTGGARGGWPLAAGAGLVLAAAAGVAAQPDLVRAVPRLLLLLAPATAGWLLASGAAARRGPVAGGGAVALVLAVSLLARLALTLPEGPLSDDLYRYLWEGRVGNAGASPFRHAPDSAALAPLRDDTVWPRVNHPDVSTIYPPVAQLLFRGLDAAGGDPRAPRRAAAGLDTAVVALLALLLRRRGKSPLLAVVYGWCPLAWLESGGGGHVDSFGVALLAAALLARERPTAAGAVAGGALLGLSALVKPLAPLLVPALLVDLPARRRVFLLAGGALSLLVAIPWIADGARLFTGLSAYAWNWRFNAAVYPLLLGAGVDPRPARVVLAAATLLAALAPLAWSRRPLAAAGAVTATALLLSPTVHPWYALWLLAFLPFLSRPLAPAGFAFAALLPLTYLTAWNAARGGAWTEPVWMPLVTWGVPLALFTGGLAAGRMRRPGGA